MTSATPGPIPIIRAGDNSSNAMSDGTPIARPGSSSSYLGLSAGLSGSSSFKEAMAVSFGKDVAEMLEYSIGRFSSSTDSEATVAAPSSVCQADFATSEKFAMEASEVRSASWPLL